MSRTYDVAVVGATGAVGETMISIREERNFPVGELYPLASSRSAGKTIMFRGSTVRVEDLADFDFSRDNGNTEVMSIYLSAYTRQPLGGGLNATFAGTFGVHNHDSSRTILIGATPSTA